MGFLDTLNGYEQHKYIDDRYILFIHVVIIFYRPIHYVICIEYIQFSPYKAKEHFITYEVQILYKLVFVKCHMFFYQYIKVLEIYLQLT